MPSLLWQVTLASRRRVQCKPYDIDLELVGDRRAEVLQKFGRLEAPRERLKFIAALRGGGSMSPDMRGYLNEFEAAAAGAIQQANKPDYVSFDLQQKGCADDMRLTHLQGVEVSEAHWVPAPASGPAGSDEGADTSVGEVQVRFSRPDLAEEGESAAFDFVWLATGGNLDLNLVPLLASFQAQRPICTVGGLPVLQPDLSWDAGVSLYVMGAFAQLQLGADALNLAGARSGSVLVARALLGAAVAAEVTAEATAEAEDEELLEDVTHRQQTDPPNTTPNTGVPGAPAAGAAGDALNTTRMAPALRTVPIAGIEAERDWLRSLPVLPSLPSQPTLAEARRVKTERPLPPVERASEEDPSVLRF